MSRIAIRYNKIDKTARIFIDGEELPIKAGSCFRVDPAGRRCLKAGKNGLRYLCIQSARDSLKGFTMTDGVVEEGAKAPKPSWM